MVKNRQFFIQILFENDGIDVESVISRPFEQVKIRPSSYGIEFHREGQKLRFHLPKILKVSVELDGNLKKSSVCFVFS